MKKKLAIFGIFLQDHDVFLLDEPFNRDGSVRMHPAEKG